MPTYILRAGDTDKVKIGWTDCVMSRRIAYLQCGHYEKLHLIRLIEGHRAIERWMHLHFRAARIRNEWFRFEPAMLTVTAEQIEPPPAKMSDARRAQISAAIRTSWREGNLRRTFEGQQKAA